jgi:hypothetical protein
MKKIASIPTHSFEPISFGDTYLYTHYEKLRSFLHVNFDQATANFIAKPVIKNSEVSWYVNHFTDFKKITEFDQETQSALLSNYWNTITTVNKKINSLKSRTNNDQNEWYSLLISVFDSENNVIYSDGQNIAILWGWKFFNAHENKIPTFTPQVALIKPIVPDYIPENNADFPVQQLIDIDTEQQEVIVEEEPVVIEEEKLSFWARFLEFLKWFAATFWWLLLTLLLLILFLFLFKSCENDQNNLSYQEIQAINKRIEYLQKKSNECCGCDLNVNEK